QSRIWDIAYYVNFRLFKPHYSLGKPLGSTKNSRITGAFFTHKENNKYYKRAAQVDFCISPCKRSMNWAKKFNKNSFIVYHGIDLEEFKPFLHLGFIGKTADNGRKGEHLFPLVRNLPFVKLHCTEGKIPQNEMNNFYQKLDAVLITSTVEGGPLCFQEGLACGKEIISTDVGMVSDFKHCDDIHIFNRKEPQELIKILENLYKIKNRRRKIIEQYSIDYFVKKHIKIFNLMANK
ncbi:MAG: glycosyltransferase, partial [Chitinispirillia bacterium]